MIVSIITFYATIQNKAFLHYVIIIYHSIFSLTSVFMILAFSEEEFITVEMELSMISENFIQFNPEW